MKNKFDVELDREMQKEMNKSIQKQAMKDLDKAVDCLHSAADILEEIDMVEKSAQIMKILEKLGQDNQDAKKENDHHTKGLTSEKQVKNLLDHGTVFNMNKNDSDDLNNLEIGDEGLEVAEKELEKEMDFEDEI